MSRRQLPPPPFCLSLSVFCPDAAHIRTHTRNVDLLQIDEGAYTRRQRVEAIVADVKLPQPVQIEKFLGQRRFCAGRETSSASTLFGV